MRISGHETRAIFDRYNITSDQDLRDARDRRAVSRAGVFAFKNPRFS